MLRGVVVDMGIFFSTLAPVQSSIGFWIQGCVLEAPKKGFKMYVPPCTRNNALPCQAISERDGDVPTFWLLPYVEVPKASPEF